MEGLSIIIPCYNEESRGSLSNRIKDVVLYMNNLDIPYELIYVNDCSTDKTKIVLFEEAMNYDHVYPLSYDENKGKGYAERIGISNANYDYILLMDCDNSVPLDYISKFWEIRKTETLLCGNRYGATSIKVTKRGQIRELISRLCRKTVNLVFGIQMTDTQCGFKMFYKYDIEQLLKTEIGCDRWLFDLELILYFKNRCQEIVEIPVVWLDELPSTMNIRKAIKNCRSEMWLLFCNKNKIGKE